MPADRSSGRRGHRGPQGATTATAEQLSPWVPGDGEEHAHHDWPPHSHGPDGAIPHEHDGDEVRMLVGTVVDPGDRTRRVDRLDDGDDDGDDATAAAEPATDGAPTPAPDGPPLPAPDLEPLPTAPLATDDGNGRTPARVEDVAIPPPAVIGRLGADLGSMEVIKASARILIPDGPDKEWVVNEWVLTMGLSDLVGRMLNAHRGGQLAPREVVADAVTLIGQIDHARQLRVSHGGADDGGAP